MVRRLFLTFVVAALVVVAPAQGATSVSLRFTSYTTVTKTFDTTPHGKANKGDRIEFKDLLVTTANQLGKKPGKAVGYDAGTVFYTSPTTQTISGTTTFPGVGTLTFKGLMASRKDGTVHVPVVKGTGAFKGARGTLVIGAGQNKAPNTYVLTLPHPLCIGTCA
jgi:hypothetical protein